MFVQSGLCREYVKCHEGLKWLIGTPINWSPNTKELTINILPFKRSLLISSFVFLAQMIQFVRQVGTTPFSGKKEKNEGVADSSRCLFMYATTYAIIVHFSWTMIRHKEEMDKFFKGLIDFEQAYCGSKMELSREEKKRLASSKATCLMMAKCGQVATPFSLGMISVMMPSLPIPMNLLSYPPGEWLIAAINNSGLPETLVLLVVKAVLFIVNFYIFGVIFGLGILLANGVLVGSTSLTVAISLFNRNIRRVSNWRHGVTTGRVECRVSMEGKCREAFGMYREIQLLSWHFNQVHSYTLLSMLGVTVYGQVTYGLGLVSDKDDTIKSRSVDQFTKYFLRSVYIEGLILCVIAVSKIYGFCAGVYHNSSKCVGWLNHSESVKKSKWIKKFVTSMPPIKVTLGETNYIRKITPVIYQQYATERFVDALLLTR